MENGDKGSIGKKKKDAFTVGDELKYTIEQNDKGYYNIKEVREDNYQKSTYVTNNYVGNGKSQEDKTKFIGFAMSYAKDLCVAGKVDFAQIKDTADVLYDWMVEKHDPQKKEEKVETKDDDSNFPF